MGALRLCTCRGADGTTKEQSRPPAACLRSHPRGRVCMCQDLKTTRRAAAGGGTDRPQPRGRNGALCEKTETEKKNQNGLLHDAAPRPAARNGGSSGASPQSLGFFPPARKGDPLQWAEPPEPADRGPGGGAGPSGGFRTGDAAGQRPPIGAAHRSKPRARSSVHREHDPAADAGGACTTREAARGRHLRPEVRDAFDEPAIMLPACLAVLNLAALAALAHNLLVGLLAAELLHAVGDLLALPGLPIVVAPPCYHEDKDGEG